MVFEIIEKGLRGFPIGSEQISISKTSISFGDGMGKEFLDKGFVKVFLDRELNRVGFEPSTDSIRGFKVQKSENKLLARITSKLACQFIPQGLFDAREEDKLWVIKVPEIAKK